MKILVLVIIQQLFLRSSLVSLCLPPGSAYHDILHLAYLHVSHPKKVTHLAAQIGLDRQGLSKNQGASALNTGTLSYGSVVEGTGVTRLGSRENLALPSSDRTTGDNLHESLCLLYIQSLSGLGGPGKLPQGWRLKCAVKRGTSKYCHVTVLALQIRGRGACWVPNASKSGFSVNIPDTLCAS